MWNSGEAKSSAGLCLTGFFPPLSPGRTDRSSRYPIRLTHGLLSDFFIRMLLFFEKNALYYLEKSNVFSFFLTDLLT